MTNSTQVEDPGSIRFDRTPGGASRFRLTAAVTLPADIEHVFAFFSDAWNLETLTPPWLHFHVESASPPDIADGTMIDYRLRLRGIPIRWRSRISCWHPPTEFVDEQIRGPYRRWHHTHVFEPTTAGTRCRDVVEYDVPGGWFIERAFVRPQLRQIFTYRQRRMLELFSTDPTGEACCATAPGSR